MPKASNSADSSVFACSLQGCTRIFTSKQGLLVHQRTCITKQTERDQKAQYEAEIEAERSCEANGVLNFSCSVISDTIQICSRSTADDANHPMSDETPKKDRREVRDSQE
jgi:hypothetical protein